MKDHLLRTALTLSGLLFIVIVFGSITIVAQETITGTWNAEVRTGKLNREDTGRIQLNFSRKRESGNSQNGSTYEYSDLQGLTREQALGEGKVSFRLVREAGTVSCEGSFLDGRGTGVFTFTPDMSFVQTLRAKGFDI